MSKVKSQFMAGVKDGLPIGLGYLPIAVTVGMGLIAKGFSFLTNFLSSFSVTAMGTITMTSLMTSGETYIGIFLALFLINLRHIVLSLALSQKLERNVPIFKRFLIGIGITDENFAVAISKGGEISASYYIGVTVFPWLCWILGAVTGSLVGDILPPTLTTAMQMALCGMLLYALVPSAKKSRTALYTIVLSGLVSTAISRLRPLFANNSVMSFVFSPSISLVIGSILSASIIAAKFPSKEDGEE